MGANHFIPSRPEARRELDSSHVDMAHNVAMKSLWNNTISVFTPNESILWRINFLI